MEVMDVLSKALLPIVRSVLGSFSSVIPTQPEKAFSPIVSSWESSPPKVISCMAAQPSKALSPMSVVL